MDLPEMDRSDPQPSAPEVNQDHRPAPAGVGEHSQPDTLFGLSFKSESRARQFMLAINDLARNHKLHLVDAVLVVKDVDDRVRVQETIDPEPGRSALSGAVWTGLLGLILGGPVGWIAGIGVGASVGAISAKVIDLGIPDEWVSWFKDAVQTDSATVIVLASNIDQNALSAEVERFPGAQLMHTSVEAEGFAALNSAIVDQDAKT